MKQNGSVANIYRPCEIKKHLKKPWSFISFAWSFSIPEFFGNPERFSYIFYRHCETKIFQLSLVISPSYAWNFAMREIFWNTEVFPNEIFWYCVTKSFRRRNLIPPTLWCIKFFATRNFRIHRSVPQRTFSVLWDKNFWTKSRDTPSFAKHIKNQWWNWCL